MQICRALLLSAPPQPFAQLLRALRSGEEALQKRAQIESGPTNHDRHCSTRLDLLAGFADLARVFSGRNVAGWVNEIEQMMRDESALGECWFRRADLELAVHGHRIAVHDLALEALGQRQRECSLSASRRAQDYHQQRLGRHGQRAL